jgi:hypothetical protein
MCLEETLREGIQQNVYRVSGADGISISIAQRYGMKIASRNHGHFRHSDVFDHWTGKEHQPRDSRLSQIRPTRRPRPVVTEGDASLGGRWFHAQPERHLFYPPALPVPWHMGHWNDPCQPVPLQKMHLNWEQVKTGLLVNFFIFMVC